MSALRRLLGFLAPRREAAGQPPAPPPAPPAVPVVAVGDPVPATPAPAPVAAPVAFQAAAVGMTPRDLDRLRGVHPDLVRVVVRARAITPFLVSEGLRSVERQRDMILSGLSKIPLAQAHTGRHVTGHAVDLYPISATPIPRMTRADYEPVAAAMRRAAAIEGVPLTIAHYAWGWDSPHYELPPGYYP